MLSDPRVIFQTIAEIMRKCNPPNLRIGGLEGKHANFADLDGDNKVKVQVQWRPPLLVQCLVFDDMDPTPNQRKADLASKELTGEFSARLIRREDLGNNCVLKMQLEIEAFHDAQSIAEAASIQLLFLIYRTSLKD